MEKSVQNFFFCKLKFQDFLLAIGTLQKRFLVVALKESFVEDDARIQWDQSEKNFENSFWAAGDTMNAGDYNLK